MASSFNPIKEAACNLCLNINSSVSQCDVGHAMCQKCFQKSKQFHCPICSTEKMINRRHFPHLWESLRSRNDGHQERQTLLIEPTPARQSTQRTSTSTRPSKNKETSPERAHKRPIPAGQPRDDSGKSPLKRGDSPSRLFTATSGGYTSAASKADLEVVIRSDREEGTVTVEETEVITKHLVSEMKRLLDRPGTQPKMSLRFRYSGRIEEGFYMVIAEDEHSRDWLLNDCHSLVWKHQNCRAIRAADAPWPVEVAFVLKNQKKPMVQETVEFLYCQNIDQGLNVRRWKHLETQGKPGDWTMKFRISRSEMAKLRQVGCQLFYQLITVRVFMRSDRRETAEPVAVPSCSGGSGQPKRFKQ